MSELLAWDGPWSPDLVRLMLPVAVEILTKRELSFYNGALAAVGSLFAKEVGPGYRRSLEEVLREVRQEQYAARGMSRDEIADLMAEEIAGKILGMKGMKRT